MTLGDRRIRDHPKAARTNTACQWYNGETRPMHNADVVLLSSFYVFNLKYPHGLNNFYTVLEALVLNILPKNPSIVVSRVPSLMRHEIGCKCLVCTVFAAVSRAHSGEQCAALHLVYSTHHNGCVELLNCRRWSDKQISQVGCTITTAWYGLYRLYLWK